VGYLLKKNKGNRTLKGVGRVIVPDAHILRVLANEKRKAIIGAIYKASTRLGREIGFCLNSGTHELENFTIGERGFVALECPAEKFSAVIHTHPGKAGRVSPKDIALAREIKIPVCAVGKDGIQCVGKDGKKMSIKMEMSDAHQSD